MYLRLIQDSFRFLSDIYWPEGLKGYRLRLSSIWMSKLFFNSSNMSYKLGQQLLPIFLASTSLLLDLFSSRKMSWGSKSNANLETWASLKCLIGRFTERLSTPPQTRVFDVCPAREKSEQASKILFLGLRQPAFLILAEINREQSIALPLYSNSSLIRS